MVYNVDLTGPNRYEPLDALSAGEVFDLGIKLAQALPHMRVLVPIGDAPEDSATLDGKLLSKKGVKVF